MDEQYADFAALDPERRSARAELLDWAQQFAPPGFDLEAFCDDLAGHLEAPPDKKLLLFSDLIIRNVPTALLLDIRQELNESIERWNGILGPATAAAVRRTVARHGADPHDLDALAALPREDSDEDAAVLLFVFARTAGRDVLFPAQQRQLLRAAAAAGPRHPDVQSALGRFFTILANDELEDRPELLAQAEHWLRRALDQAPDNPVYNDNLAHVLVEGTLNLDGPASVPLLRQASVYYTAALRCAAAAGISGKVVERVLFARATINWQLAAYVPEQEERKRLLEEGLDQIELLVAQEEIDPELEVFFGKMALELGRCPGSEESRRQAFELARGRFEKAVAADPTDRKALCRWAGALLGLAGLSTGAARRELVERGAALLAEAVGYAPDDASSYEAAAAGWLHLAVQSTGTERRDAAERAMAAARRALELEPEEGEYNLACALCLLDRTEEAAQALTVAIAHTPDLAVQALTDSDLAPLLETRPDLRARLEAEVERQVQLSALGGAPVAPVQPVAR